MKIFYVGNYKQKHCTEVHLAATLEDLGHQVTRQQESDLQPGRLAELAQGHDLVLWTRTMPSPVTNDDIEALRASNITSVSYHLDLYVGIKRESGLRDDPFWRTDFVFTPDGDPGSAKVFEQYSINHYYMPAGVYKPECVKGTPKPELTHDIIFVGGGRGYHPDDWPYRMKLINWLETTYGDRFKKYGHPETPAIRNQELNDLYASSKIVIGDTLCPGFTHERYWSDRVYETIGRGGFIVHPYIKGLEQQFITDENGLVDPEKTELVTYPYDDFGALKAAIDYFLDRTDVRTAIRDNGMRRVIKDHTYHNRLAEMLRIVESEQLKQIDKEASQPTTTHQAETIKINLGAGTDIREGWYNVDRIPLQGINVVHNLMKFPYPFNNGVADEIRAIDVLEHLDHYTKEGKPTVLRFIQECHRILQPGGKLFIQTPRYDAEFLWIDPTHVRGFHEQSMDFFDPDKPFGKSTGFYSDAKFQVGCKILENKNLQFTMVKR